MRRSTFAPLVLVVALGLLQAACAAVVVGAGAGAATGMTAAQERGVGGVVSDTTIKARISGLWKEADERLGTRLRLQVQEGRVLVSGVVEEPEMRLEAVRLAWQVDGVEEVINEISVSDAGKTFGDFTQDTWITTQLRSRLVMASDVRSLNYSIETLKGTVYLMGIAQSQRELERVLNHARNIRNVQQVVSYVRIRGSEDDDLEA